MNQYKPLGIEHGASFLLPPSTALHFAADLQKINVAIMGVDGWFYVNQDKGWIVQDLEVDLSIDEDTLQENNAVEKSVAIVSRFISQELPKRTEFVSLTLDSPDWWAPDGGKSTPSWGLATEGLGFADSQTNPVTLKANPVKSSLDAPRLGGDESEHHSTPVLVRV